MRDDQADMACKVAAALFGSRMPRSLIAVLIIWSAVMGVLGGVGYWQGEIVFEPGDTRQVTLYVGKFLTFWDIVIHGRGDGGPRPDIRVSAKICGPKGSVRYDGHGDVANREGTRFTFGLAPDGTPHGKHPNALKGAWDGKDRLQLTTRFYTQGPDGARAEASIAAAPGSDDPGVIQFEMRRVTEDDFDAAC